MSEILEKGLSAVRNASTSSQIGRRNSVSHSFAAENVPNKVIIEDATAALAKEQDMTILQGIKAYPKAIAWSLIFSTAIIMEGYDLTVLGAFFIAPVFSNKFGTHVQEDGSKIISAEWQAALGNAMMIGQILGLLANGWLADKFGYKKIMFGSLFWTACAVLILFFAQNASMLLAGELVMGFPLGVFQTLTITYATEVCPVVLRCYLTTYVNLCWVLGQFIASGIVKAMFETRDDEWMYRIPFALQWAWILPLMVGVTLAPESPWWLVRVDRIEDAKRSIERLASAGTSTNADQAVAMMIHTNELEKEIHEGTTYLDCFKGVDLRRTEIASITWLSQSFCGSGLMGAAAYFYRAAGLPESSAYSMALGQYGLGIVGVLVAWIAMTHLGRRTLYVWGLFVLATLVFIVGCTSFIPGAMDSENPNTMASWISGSLILVFAGIYNFTVGPVCYSLVSEIPSTRLRQKTVVIARTIYNLAGVCLGVLIPYMLNPTGWNLMQRSGFIWSATGFACFAWAFFRLPEPKGRTFAEMDILFEQKVSARKFATTDVDVFDGGAEAKEVQEISLAPKH